LGASLQNSLLDPPETVDPHQRQLCGATPQLLSSLEAERQSLVTSTLHTVASLLVLWLEDPAESVRAKDPGSSAHERSSDAAMPADTATAREQETPATATSYGDVSASSMGGQDARVSLARAIEQEQGASGDVGRRGKDKASEQRLPVVLTCSHCGAMGTAALRCSRCRLAVYCGR
jgi:hypothetical protein